MSAPSSSADPAAGAGAAAGGATSVGPALGETALTATSVEQADRGEAGDESAGEGAGATRSVPSVLGPGRLGDRLSERRGPVVAAAVVAVVALIAIAAWAAAGGGGNGDNDGGRDAPSATTAADGEASQTTAADGEAADGETTTTSTSTSTTSTTTSTTTGAGEVPEGWTTYEGPNGVYTIAHPEGWQVQPADGPRVRIRDPESGSYLLVDWTDEPRPDPVADWRSQSQTFASRHEGYQEIRIEPFDYRDYNAAVWEFRYRDQGVDLHVANLGFVAGDRGYALYFQTHEDQWQSSQPTFASFRQTFQPG